jgi:hypothetical protein
MPLLRLLCHNLKIIHMGADVIIAIFHFAQLHPDIAIISHGKKSLLQ